MNKHKQNEGLNDLDIRELIINLCPGDNDRASLSESEDEDNGYKIS